MSESKFNLSKASYMLKRLRDSGYRADKILGVSDPISKQKDLENLTKRLFLDGKHYSREDIMGILTTHTSDFLRCMYIQPNYSDMDSRVWTILIDSGRGNVFLTFFKNSKDSNGKYDEYGNDFFELYDGNLWIQPTRKKLRTHSFEVLANALNEMGITKKYHS